MGWRRSIIELLSSLSIGLILLSLLLSTKGKWILPIQDIATSFFHVVAAVFTVEGRRAWHERKQKKRLRAMLKDTRFPKGFRSTEQLLSGIGADRQTAERLLLDIGARKSETSDEWTLNPPGQGKPNA